MTPLATITNYEDLIATMRARADELSISRETIDNIAGFPDRYAAKLLGLKSVKRIGMQSLGPILAALGLMLIAVPNEETLEHYRARRSKRNNSQIRPHRRMKA